MNTNLPSAKLMLAATVVMLLTSCATIPNVEEIVCGYEPITGQFTCVYTPAGGELYPEDGKAVNLVER